MRRAGFLAQASLIALMSISLELSADPTESADHPMISRYPGSVIEAYSQDEFADYPLVMGAVKGRNGRNVNPDAFLLIAGKVTRILYRAPEGRPTSEVFHSYVEKLGNAGFKALFECDAEACGAQLHWTVVGSGPMLGVETEQCFLAAHLPRAEGDLYVSLYANKDISAGNDSAMVALDIIELKPTKTDMVAVDAEAMAQGLGTDGHIALYGIFFDTGDAVLKPESAPTLEKIGRLLESQPELNLLIVGHTDNEGGFAHNLNLSRRRAAAVVNALTGQYGIDTSRLEPHGIGYLAPMASNRDEAGRAKNRRVELVAP